MISDKEHLWDVTQEYKFMDLKDVFNSEEEDSLISKTCGAWKGKHHWNKLGTDALFPTPRIYWLDNREL